MEIRKSKSRFISILLIVAPGMKYRHYAPKADLAIVEGPTEEVIHAINQFVKEDQANGLQAGIIATEETISKYPLGTALRRLGSVAIRCALVASTFLMDSIIFSGYGAYMFLCPPYFSISLLL